MANPFAETRLGLGVAQFYGASYSLNYDTLITTMGGGSEQRRINWDQGIIGIQLSTRVLNTEELTYLLAFHEARNGAYEGFRVKDWSDYKAINQPLGTGDGSEKTFQLVKVYTVAGVSVTRAITKPVAGTVKVYLDGIEQEDNWSVDTTTGQVTTTLDGTLTASCEFDIPMRFEQDKIDSQFNAYRSDNKFFDGQGFSLIELRNKAEIPFDTVPQSLDHLFALYYDYGTIGGPEFSTSIIKTESGFEDRLQNWESSLGKWNVGNRRLNRVELDYFIALFRVCRGRGVAFNFKDWQSEAIKRVRFDEDKISFSFSAFRAGDEEVFFDLGGIGVRQTEAIVCTPKSLSFQYNFSGGAWTRTYFDNYDGGFGEGTVAAAEMTIVAGGNSGNCARIQLDFGGVNSAGVAAFWQSPFSYIPTTADEILTFTYSEDHKFVSGSPLGQVWWFCVMQNGVLKMKLGGTTGNNASWTPHTLTATASELGLTVIPFVPIYFGVLRSNQNGVGFSGIGQTVALIDNWSVGVTVGCP